MVSSSAPRFVPRVCFECGKSKGTMCFRYNAPNSREMTLDRAIGKRLTYKALINA